MLEHQTFEHVWDDMCELLYLMCNGVFWVTTDLTDYYWLLMSTHAWLIVCLDVWENYLFWCSNHILWFLSLCYFYCCCCLLYVFVVCWCCSIYIAHLVKLWKSCFAKKGNFWSFLIDCMECTRYFCEERTHVEPDVLVCVQHLALVSRPMLLLFWANFLDVCNKVYCYILAIF